MIKTANKIQKKFSCGVYCPANDFMQGIVDGNFDYDNYFNNTQIWLSKSNAMFVVDGYETSRGTLREIEYAKRKKIPIFYNFYELEEWLNRPIIITICGKSGSGKTTIANYLQDELNIPMVESYTTRPRRTPNEKGHTFISQEEFDKIDKNDMIAYTNFGGNDYCCLKNQVEDINTYVIDERGLLYLQTHYSDYKIYSILIQRDNIDVEENRSKRDEANFFLDESYYDFVINNDSELKIIFEVLKTIISSIQQCGVYR